MRFHDGARFSGRVTMIKKLEAWLRRIVAAEIAKVNTSLQNERDVLQSHFEMVDEAVKAHLTILKTEVSRVVEENTALKNKVHELQHHRWVASPEEIANDHALKMVK